MKNPHYAVIGSSGFLGKRLCSFLSSVNAIYSPIRFYESSFYDISNGPSRLTQQYSEHFTHIIDCSNPSYSSNDDPRFLSSSLNFCESLTPFLLNVKYVLLSSISVFGDSQSYISEDVVPLPSNNYGKGKLFKESYFADMYNSGLLSSLSIIRSTGILGPGMGQTFVKRLVDSAYSNKPLEIYSKSSLFSSIIFIDDLIDLIFNSFCYSDLNYFFAASVSPLSLSSLCRIITNYCCSRSTILETRNGRPPFSIHISDTSYSHSLKSTATCLTKSLPYISPLDLSIA